MSAEIRKVGVIGAGQMGKGIAQVCAVAGLDVNLNDISETRVKEALTDINPSLARDIERHRLDDSARAVVHQRIKPATDFAAFHDCDIVIEAATENEETKRQIFRELCPALKPEAIIASNTSSISITRLASITDRPERFIGIHFMNPVPRTQLVELIRGIATEHTTYEASRDFVLTLGKTVNVAEDSPAFIVNRMQRPLIIEATNRMYEGFGSVDSIDTAMKLG